MRKLLTVTAFTAMLTLLRMAAGFLVAKVVAIYAGPSGLAMLGQMQSLVTSLNGLVGSPAGSGLVRYTAENYNNGYDSCAPWWRASLCWVFILLLVVIPVSIIFSECFSTWLLGRPDYSWLVITCVSFLPFSVSGFIINSVINGQQQYRRYISLGMLSVLISSSIMILLIIHNNSEGALIAASVQSGLIGCVMLSISIKQPWFKVKYWFGRIEIGKLKQTSGYILMAITSAITVPISLIIVRNILSENVGWELVGQWQAVWKISETYLAVTTIALSTYYLPRLASLKTSDEVKCEINLTARIILPLVALMAICIYVLRDFIINLLFTDEFGGARDLFAVQLCGDFLKMTSWLYAYPLLSRGLVKWFVFTEVFFSILFVVMSYMFVMDYGVIGVNYAYAVNYAVCLFFVLFIMRPASR